jgi:predicted amidophosphoribosyltransferase
VISEGPSLIEALSGPLQDALGTSVGAGEALRIAVRGGLREALAATDQRVLILREAMPASGGGIEVSDLSLSDVTNVDLDSAAAGSRLTLRVRGQETPVALDVPVYDHVKFGRVAERLSQLAGAARRNAGARADPGARKCPKCSTPVPADGAFCTACGMQVADVCAGCARVLEEGWQHCPRCGLSAHVAGILPCPGCGQPVWPMQAFCTDCGAPARPRCPGCGGALISSWDHCAACGAPIQENEAGPQTGLQPSATVAGAPAAAASAEAEALNDEGTRAYEQDQLDEAISLFQRAILRVPQVAKYHTNLGVAYAEKGMDFEAYAAYRRALELDPEQPQLRLNLGYLYSERERYEQAREEWEKVIAMAPGSEEAQEARENLNHLDEL